MNAFPLLLLLAFLCGRAEAQGKKAYDVWTKEKVRYLENRVIRDPYDARLRVLLANAYSADGKKRKARDQLKEALELRPDFPEAHCNLAVLLHGQGAFESAEEHYREALRLDSTMVEAMAGLGALLCQVERQAEGLEYLEKVALLRPDYTSARYNMAVAYHKIGDFARAIHHLEALLEIAPRYPGARRALARSCYSLGLIRLQAGQPRKALDLFDRALQYEGNDENMLFAKGLAHMDLAEYSGAAAAFEKVVALNAEHLPALHNLGAVYERMGRLEEAKRCYDRVKALAPRLGTIEAVKQATFDVNYLLK